MASEVDKTFPADTAKVSKGDFRAQMTIIYNEITELQRKTGIPWKIAVGDLTI